MSFKTETPNPIHDNNTSPQQVTTNTPALANNANVLDNETILASMSSQSPQSETKTPNETLSDYLNRPGKWKTFFGHSRRSGDGVALANETYHEYDKQGLPSWLDVRMADTSEPAMKEGVQNSESFIAIVTGPCVNPDRPDDKPEDNAYFRREYCLKELRWARGAGKPIVCIVRVEDKSKVDELFSYAPDDLKYLRANVVYFDRNDRDYQKIGVRKMLIASGLRSEGYGQATPAINDLPPKNENGVHWKVVYDDNDDRGNLLTLILTQSLTNRGYTVGKKDDDGITTCDALLVVLTDNTFSDDVSNCVRAARKKRIPVVCVVHAEDKSRIWPLAQNAPDDLKDLADDSIYHIVLDDPDYLECGVT